VLSHQAILRAAAASYGDRIAITSAASGDITHGEFVQAVRRLADALSKAGLAPGDVVTWYSYNRYEYLVTYYATALAGLRFSPLNYWLRERELGLILGLLRPKLAFVEEGLRERFAAAAGPSFAGQTVELPETNDRSSGPLMNWQELAELGSPDGPWPDSDSAAVHEIIFTSGTTGQPKGVMRSARKRVFDSLIGATVFQLHRDDHLMSMGPQFHIGGAAVPGPVLLQGGHVTVLRRFEPEAVAAALRGGVTYLQGVPAHFNLLFESGVLDRLDVSSVRGVYLGGSLVTFALDQEVARRFPAATIAHGYGSTESGPYSIGLRGPAVLGRPGTIGLPAPGVEARVIDRQGGEAAPGEVGELLVRAPNVMDGYLGNDELTRQVIDAGGWYHTGDLVRRDADGYFYVADRKKDMIISGGENVYSREVEDVVSQHQSVSEVAVIGTPDPVYEECVTAVVRLRDTHHVSADELRDFTRTRLAGYKVPRRFEFVGDLPLNAVGKVDKSALRQTYGSVFSGHEDAG
jgi:fatty-acyl-CoA synthase